MPRGPRLDAPGVLHHVMVRGLERRAIFREDQDRRDFVVRVAARAQAHAWAEHDGTLRPLWHCASHRSCPAAPASTPRPHNRRASVSILPAEAA